MKISPEQFLELLQNSSLTAEDQKAIISMLPSMTMKEIQKLADILRADNKAMDKIALKVESQLEKELVKLNVELDQIKIEQDK